MKKSPHKSPLTRLKLRKRLLHRKPSIEQLEDRITPSTLIPVPDRTDIIYDATRDFLYMPTSTGKVERYNLATNRLETPWLVSASLAGGDITPDGKQFLLLKSVTKNEQVIVVHDWKYELRTRMNAGKP